MLYNTKWETKTDPLTMESLIAWLETKNPVKTYNFDDCSGGCLYGLYMKHHGINWADSGARGVGNSYPKATLERNEFCHLVYDLVAREQPWTFGAALERARAAR